MKYLVPVLATGGAIVAALTTAIAQAYGAMNSHALLRPPYVYGYGSATLLLVIAGVTAVVSSKREHRQISAPELFPRIDYPAAVRANPGLGLKRRVIILENNCDLDAYNVQVQRLCLDASGRIYAAFEPITRIGAHKTAEVKASIHGLKSGEVADDFETIYHYGEQESHIMLPIRENIACCGCAWK